MREFCALGVKKMKNAAGMKFWGFFVRKFVFFKNENKENAKRKFCDKE